MRVIRKKAVAFEHCREGFVIQKQSFFRAVDQNGNRRRVKSFKKMNGETREKVR